MYFQKGDHHPERLGSSVGEPGLVNAEGKAQVVLDEVDELLGESVNLVLRRDGQKVAEENSNLVRYGMQLDDLDRKAYKPEGFWYAKT